MSDATIIVVGRVTTIITQVPQPTLIRGVSAPVVISNPQVGPQGPRGDHGFVENFAWGDATPAVLLSVAAGAVIFSVTLVILESFDGTGAALSVGITGTSGLLLATNQCNPLVEGSYQSSPGYQFETPQILRLFITPGAGASKGNGVIIIDYNA